MTHPAPVPYASTLNSCYRALVRSAHPDKLVSFANDVLAHERAELDKHLTWAKYADAGETCACEDCTESYYYPLCYYTDARNVLKAWAVIQSGRQEATRQLAAGKAQAARVAVSLPKRDVIAEREAADKARRKARGRTEWVEALDVA